MTKKSANLGGEFDVTESFTALLVITDETDFSNSTGSGHCRPDIIFCKVVIEIADKDGTGVP